MKRGVVVGVSGEEDTLIMSIRLASGRFESSIQVPLYATDAERQAFIEQWLKLMEAGIKCGQSHRESKP